MDPAQKYKELMAELFLRRKRGLSQIEEAEFVGQLDDCWRLMTEVEQLEIESIFGDD